MTLSTPIYRLKQRAKALARQSGIPLHSALDQIAAEHGYRHWSLLAAAEGRDVSREDLYSRLKPGELVLVGARPGQGKTMLTLSVIGQALASGDHAVFYTLEWNRADVLARLSQVGVEPSRLTGLTIDSSDAISADYIVKRHGVDSQATLIVVDYLQLLDQKREHPPLMEQVKTLRVFAERSGVIILFISQIDRSFESSGRSMPGPADVRLPNPLDLTLFDHACFLNDGAIQLRPLHG
jgi:replicative DNA helicase